MYALHNKPVPRYTSYPTAPEWDALPNSIYMEKLREAPDSPLSIYVHIPFCHSICLYCGCSVILNRKSENEQRYVDYLVKEMGLINSIIGGRAVHQIHFGGGTPTKLSSELFSHLFEKLNKFFDINFSKEIALEVDPRTVDSTKMRFLKNLGFNRISLGVQDTNEQVQEAVRRRQKFSNTIATYNLARDLGFESINIDLMYGLPLQTRTTFHQTISDVLTMKPDRIALFSYARVPWLKRHQLAIKEELLPSPEEKFTIYSEARNRLKQNGYLAIGMDHFALENDELSRAFRNLALKRNFQGYTTQPSDQLIGLGITSIGHIQNTYVQNTKELDVYYNMLDHKELPTCRGKVLSDDDILRRWVIHTLMCNFELDKGQFFSRYGVEFDDYFTKELVQLSKLECDGLIINSSEKITATELGQLFIRIVASTFDSYALANSNKFSSSI